MKTAQRKSPMKVTAFTKIHEEDMVNLKANALAKGMTPSQLVRFCLIQCGAINPVWNPLTPNDYD